MVGMGNKVCGHNKFMDAAGGTGRKYETRFHMAANNLPPKFKTPGSFLTVKYAATFLPISIFGITKVLRIAII